MADLNENNTKTQSYLAYYWSIVASLILGYIVYKWGDQKEILTLIIGLISGTILGGIFGVFFGGTLNKKAPTIQQSGNNSIATTTTPEINQ